jgi:hypothetical protein
VKALIICSPDDFANGVRPREIAKYLRTRGHEVDLYSSAYLARAGKTGLAASLPGPSLQQFALYVFELACVVSARLGKLLPGSSRTLNKVTFIKQVWQLHGAVLRARLKSTNYDMIICENNGDMSLFAGRRLAPIQILDLPAPGAEEIYFGGQVTRRKYDSLRKWEVKMYAKADRISFHWHTYADYVKQNKYDGANFIDLSYGVNLPTGRASFKEQPRIVFMGFLSGYWINVPLLVKLCQLYPHIDIYGGPRLAELGDNYKGYAPTTDVLANYQFGLITLTDDPLRRHGFSSKQLRYYAYGLPVLSPKWHFDSALDEAALLYDEEDFLSLIREYSDEWKWAELSDKAFQIARHYNWDEVFRPLDPLLEGR